MIHELMSSCDMLVNLRFKTGLSPLSYQTYLSDTVFSLVPAGQSNETIRFADALTMGSIPILRKAEASFLDHFFSRPPVIVVDNWMDALPAMKKLRQSPEQLLELQRKCTAWWKRYNECVASDIRALLHKLVESSEGSNRDRGTLGGRSWLRPSNTVLQASR